jgi:hypothetical protein
VVCGLWFVVRGLWFVVRGLWVVVCSLWLVVCGKEIHKKTKQKKNKKTFTPHNRSIL